MLSFRTAGIFFYSEHDAKREVGLQCCTGQAEREGSLFRSGRRLRTIWVARMVGDWSAGPAPRQGRRKLDTDHAPASIGVANRAGRKTQALGDRQIGRAHV